LISSDEELAPVGLTELLPVIAMLLGKFKVPRPRLAPLGASIDDQSLSQIGRAFNTDTLPAFECLDLPDNNITDEGLVQFAKILETGRGLKLKTLNLVGNGFGDEGCSALAGERHAEHACMGCRVLTGIDTHVLTICRDFKNKVAGGDGAQARRK